jgi:prephenate dehydratase
MAIVAFQGENGAYSQEAAYQFFGAEVETLPCRTFEDIFFYLDFEGHWQDPPCAEALLGLLHKATFLKLLGSYPAATLEELERAKCLGYFTPPGVV